MSGQSASPVVAENDVEPRQLSLEDLEGEHRQLLIRAITRILSTELAETTYAQIIDGLPIADVAYDSHDPPHDDHPLNEAHRELCPGMLDKAREFRDGFRPEILTFDSQVSKHKRSVVAVDRPWLIVDA
jgi:hypothetical protein